MMRNVTLCDKCGERIRHGCATHIDRENICQGDWLPDTVFHYDLCPGCMKELEEWIRGNAEIERYDDDE